MPAKNEPSNLALVLLRFPEHAATIRRLMNENGEFRGMATDYILAVNMLKTLKKQVPVNFERVQEYTNLIAFLESELETFMRQASEGR